MSLLQLHVYVPNQQCGWNESCTAACYYLHFLFLNKIPLAISSPTQVPHGRRPLQPTVCHIYMVPVPDHLWHSPDGMINHVMTKKLTHDTWVSIHNLHGPLAVLAWELGISHEEASAKPAKQTRTLPLLKRPTLTLPLTPHKPAPSLPPKNRASHPPSHRFPACCTNSTGPYKLIHNHNNNPTSCCLRNHTSQPLPCCL